MSAPAFDNDSQDLQRQRELVQTLENDRSLLLLTQPFTAALAMRLKIVAVGGTLSESQRIPTAATDGKAIYFNVDFADRIDAKTRRFVLCHEVWHCVMGHLSRRLYRQPMRWNIAIDYEVNAICHELLGYHPEGCLIAKTKHGFERNESAEEIYERIQVTEQAASQVLDKHLEMSDITATEWQEFTQQLMASGRGIGKLPGHLTLRIKGIVTPPMPWQQLLRRYVQRQLRGERQWFPPSRRHIHRGLYLPRQRSEHIDLTLALDTSGSCIPYLGQFLEQLRHLLGSFASYQVTILQCDSKIQDIRQISPDRPLTISDYQVSGFGGTAFHEVFDYVRNNPTQALVFFTDGHVDLPPQPPSQPVLWVIAPQGRKRMPWGEVALMK